MKLHKEFPWLIHCEGSMDATVITSIFDIKQMIFDTIADDDIQLSVEEVRAIIANLESK